MQVIFHPKLLGLLLTGAVALPLLCAGAQAQSAPTPSHPMQLAGLFGKSDEEKSEEEAAMQREQAQDANIQVLLRKVRDLEDMNRRATGQVELLGHRIEELQNKLDRAQKDFDYKLCSLAAQMPSASSPDQQQPTGLDCPGMQPKAPPVGSSSNDHAGGDQNLAPPPGSLGTLPDSDAHAGHGDDVSGNSGKSDAHAQYNAAMGLLAKARYDEARGAFQQFADANPKDALAPQAVYWVGDIAFVQKDYPGAARAFAQEIKKYPSSPRGAESMLKLGQALIAMGQKEEGCTALGALPAKYPDASAAVTAKATKARKDASCKKA